jgi:ABC-2 type transport system ATP-binding protein
VQIAVNDDQAAIAELKDRFGLDAAMSESMVTFNVESGEQFVPRLFGGLTAQIRSVSVARPTLDDVFMSYTGKTIRDAEATAGDRNRAHIMAFRRGR